MTKPAEATEAEFILSACERFGCLPSQLLAEDATIFRLMALEAMAKRTD